MSSVDGADAHEHAEAQRARMNDEARTDAGSRRDAARDEPDCDTGRGSSPKTAPHLY